MDSARIAIVGSRNFDDYDTLVEKVNNTLSLLKKTPSQIISGGATGADNLAERYANDYNIPLKVFKPDWSKYGRSAGAIRNHEIVENSDVVIAFRVNNSPGTTITINLASNKGITVIVYDSKK